MVEKYSILVAIYVLILIASGVYLYHKHIKFYNDMDKHIDDSNLNDQHERNDEKVDDSNQTA